MVRCYQKQLFYKYVYKKRSRTAIFSVNVADIKFVEKTTNRFYKWAKIYREQLDEDPVERIQADCFGD